MSLSRFIVEEEEEDNSQLNRIESKVEQLQLQIRNMVESSEISFADQLKHLKKIKSVVGGSEMLTEELKVKLDKLSSDIVNIRNLTQMQNPELTREIQALNAMFEETVQQYRQVDQGLNANADKLENIYADLRQNRRDPGLQVFLTNQFDFLQKSIREIRENQNVYSQRRSLDFQESIEEKFSQIADIISTKLDSGSLINSITMFQQLLKEIVDERLLAKIEENQQSILDNLQQSNEKRSGNNVEIKDLLNKILRSLQEYDGILDVLIQDRERTMKNSRQQNQEIQSLLKYSREEQKEVKRLVEQAALNQLGAQSVSQLEQLAQNLMLISNQMSAATRTSWEHGSNLSTQSKSMEQQLGLIQILTKSLQEGIASDGTMIQQNINALMRELGNELINGIGTLLNSTNSTLVQNIYNELENYKLEGLRIIQNSQNGSQEQLKEMVEDLKQLQLKEQIMKLIEQATNSQRLQGKTLSQFSKLMKGVTQVSLKESDVARITKAAEKVIREETVENLAALRQEIQSVELEQKSSTQAIKDAVVEVKKIAQERAGQFFQKAQPVLLKELKLLKDEVLETRSIVQEMDKRKEPKLMKKRKLDNRRFASDSESEQVERTIRQSRLYETESTEVPNDTGLSAIEEESSQFQQQQNGGS